MSSDDRLGVALWEADRHAAALTEAPAEWAAEPARDMAQLERDRLLLRLADQILFRFTKLQDALGERLVPATLQQLAESFEDWSMRDRLERLEKLGYLGGRRLAALARTDRRVRAVEAHAWDGVDSGLPSRLANRPTARGRKPGCEQLLTGPE